ncbi:MAG: DMT family transporter [Alphaproteobacteria bacterium]|nr:DMT family transporter [Alphaproteobacteria bacterium]
MAPIRGAASRDGRAGDGRGTRREGADLPASGAAREEAHARPRRGLGTARARDGSRRAARHRGVLLGRGACIPRRARGGRGLRDRHPPRRLSAAARVEAPPRSGFVLLALLTVFWGVNWPMIKWGVTEFRPWSFRAACIVIGVAGLFACARLAGQSLAIPRRDLGPLLVASFFNMTVWHLCSAYGLSYMASGRAAIIAFTMPLWATLLAVPVLGEGITRAKAAGLALGLAGLACLLAGEVAELRRAPLGGLLMLGAAMSWAAGSLAVKRHRWEMQSFPLTGWQLLLGGLPILAGWALIEGGDVLRQGLEAPSWRGIAGTLYSATIPMIFCQWGWVRVLQVFPASVAAIGTLLIPVVGVLSSALLVGEEIGLTEVAALGLILASLAIVLGPRLPMPGRR